MPTKDWLTVDVDGLAKLVDDRRKSFILFELLQNAFDEASTTVTATLAMCDRGRVKIDVEDDNPSGFADLSHAYTMFASSKKRHDAEKRGRFNTGEKLVLALCDSAEIVTTTGHVVFDKNGERYAGRRRTQTGSRFTAIVRMSQKDLAEVEKDVTMLFPPEHIATFVNGVRLEPRTPVSTFETQLPTIIADDEGVLRSTVRKTQVRVYEPRPGETPMIYEMGIPVVEGDRWHVNVMQRVPLGQDRDAVPPSYARKLRGATLNALHTLVRGDDAKAPWVDDALQSATVDLGAVRSVIKERYGKDVVSYDPSDREANKRAADQGYTVVHGGSLSRDTWANVRRADAIAPAGRVFPTSLGIGGGSVDGEAPPAEVSVVPKDQWSPEMHSFVSMAKSVMGALLDREIAVEIVLGPFGDRAAADFESVTGRMRVNMRTLGRNWFEPSHLAAQLDLILHEAAHERVHDHFSEAYYRECTRLGGLAIALALKRPLVFAGTASAG